MKKKKKIKKNLEKILEEKNEKIIFDLKTKNESLNLFIKNLQNSKKILEEKKKIWKKK